MSSYQKNKEGGFFWPGKSIPGPTRKLIVDMYFKGNSYSIIAKETKVSASGCRKIVENFIQRETAEPSRNIYKTPSKVTDAVLTFIEYYVSEKPSVYLKEIQKQLVDDGVCNDRNVPGLVQIWRSIRKELNMTRKILDKLPLERDSPEIQDRFNDYMDTIIDIDPKKIKFYDEASVIRTTGNRKYGYSEKGKRAVEIQRYASNVSLSVELLVGTDGVLFFEVIEGPSNGMELLFFFEQAVTQRNDFGNPILEWGDTLVMDNCGFHHGRETERNLRDLLGRYGVQLLFQPPYHPELNICEFAFRILKEYLRANDEASAEFTELVTIHGLNSIKPLSIFNCYKQCGYV